MPRVDSSAGVVPRLRRTFLILLVFCFALAARVQAQPVTNLVWSIGQQEWALYDAGPWVLVSGTLPTGISLRLAPDVPPWATGATATLSGVATTPSATPYIFTLSHNGVPQAFSIKITALTKKEWSVPDAFVGRNYNYQLTALNNAGPVTWALTANPMTNPSNVPPPGMTLSPSGLLSGPPTQSGFYNIYFSIYDGTDTTYHAVSINVYDIHIDPDSGALGNGTVNQAYSQTLIATGGTPPYRFTADFMPPGLILSETGGISGTPTGSGRYTPNVTATDSRGLSYTKRMSLSIANSPSNLLSAGPYGPQMEDCPFAVPCNRGVYVSVGKAPYTWTFTGLPPGMSGRYAATGATTWWFNPGDLEIWGTATQMGTFHITATVTDGDGQTAGTEFDLNVRPLWLWNYLPGGTVGMPYSSSLRVLGGRLPYTGKIISGQIPAGTNWDENTLTLSGTPQENGGFTLVIEITDADGAKLRTNHFPYFGSTTSTITLNSSYDLGTITEGFSYSNQLQACCVPSFNWIVTGGSLPSGLTLSPSGLLSGTPAAGSSGTYTFTVRVEDFANSTNFAVRQFKLVVTPLFVSTITLPIGNVGVPYSGALVVSTASGVASATWQLEQFQSMPPGLRLNGDGTVTGIPTTRGQFNFQVRATDGAGHYLIRFFTIQIYGAGEVPPLNLTIGANLGTFSVGQQQFQLSTTGGVPPYHYSLTPGAIPIDGMRVQDGQPLPTVFSPTITGGFIGVMTTPGTFTTSIRVTDSAQPTPHVFDRATSITISRLAILSATSPPRPTVGRPYSFTLTPFGGTVYQWSATRLPPGLSIDAFGEIAGTPTTAGFFVPTIQLTDLTTASSLFVAIPFTVDPFEITSGGILPQGVVGTAYNQTLNVPGCTGTCTWTPLGTFFGGITLNSAGLLAGTPTFSGSTTFTATVTGSNGAVSKTFFLVVAPSTNPQPLSANSLFIGDSTIGNQATIALLAQGGTPPYTWSVVSGTLPLGVSVAGPGETLASGLTPGASYLFGRVMALGPSVFTLKVTDSAGASVTLPQSTWKVGPLAFGYFNLPGFNQQPLVYNTPYMQPLLVMGGSNDYAFSSPSMPPGLGLTATGVVNGAPTNTGFMTAPVTADDHHGNTMTANISFNVAGPTSTLLNIPTGANLGTIQYGNTPSYTMTPTNGTSPYTITVVDALPPLFTLQPQGSVGGAVVTGVATTPGTYTFTIMARDSAGNIGVRTFTLTVAPFALLGQGQSLPDGTVGQSYSHTLTLLNGGTVSVAPLPGSTLPPGVNLSGGVLSGIPTTAGTFTFTLMATDSVTKATVNYGFSLRISNIALSDTPLLPPAVAGVPYSYSFNPSGGGSTKVWTATGLPSGLTMSPSGTITGMATLSSTGQTFGLFVTVNDGGTPLSRRFTLQVVDPNPSVLDIALALTVLPDAQAGQQVAFTLPVSGGRAPYTWAVAPGSSLPSGLRLLTGAELSAAAFAPGTTLLAGIPTIAGQYSFDLIATDSTNTQVRRTFTLNVSLVGTVNAFVPTLNTTTSASVQFVAVGGTPPYSFDKAPTGPTQDMLPPGVTLDSNGLLSGMPTSTGLYRFVLKVTDSAGHTFSRTIAFTVVASTTSGTLVLNTNVNGSVGRRLFQSLNAASINGTVATYSWSKVSGNFPPGIGLVTDPRIIGNATTTMLGGQPTAAGTFSYTLRATNTANAADVADHAFTVFVSPIQLAFPYGAVGPTTLPPGHTGEVYSANIRVTGGVPPYAFVQAGPMPPGLSVSTTGVIAGTPQSIGFFLPPIQVTDSAGNAFNPVTVIIVTPPGVPSPLLSTQANLAGAAVGMPYAVTLELLVRAGVAPFTFTLDAGSSLPPGLRLIPGGAAAGTLLAGIPSAAGTFTFSLTATDGASQTLTVPVTMVVASVGLSQAGTLPSAIVGQSYSISLGPSGGTPPYTILPWPTLDLPAGLGISNAGVLSGTPLSAGTFLVGALIVDSAGSGSVKAFSLVVDNAAGEAPAARLAPSPVRIQYTIGSPAPAPVPLSLGMTNGSTPYTLTLGGAPWASLGSTSGTAPATTAINLNVAGLAAGTYDGILGLDAPGSINRVDFAQVILDVANPPPCSYSVTPTSTSVPAVGASGTITVNAGSTCSWTAAPSGPITITSGSSGTGNGTVKYTVPVNRTASQQTGSITVNGAVFSFTQFASNATCSFSISPSTIPATAAGGTVPVAIAASNSTCAWTAAGLGATPASGTGSRGVTVTIPPNPNVDTATLNATIAGRALTVTQTGIACTTSLDQATASYSSAGGTGSVAVTVPTGCSYATVLGPSWIHVASGDSGTGSGTLQYSVDPNSITQPRSGTLTIGGRSFQITQEPLACSTTIDTSALGSPFGTTGGVGSIGITMNGPNCSWTASSGAPWITVAPTSGTGNTTLLVTVGSNGGSLTGRSALLTINGQTVGVDEDGIVCSFKLQSPTGSAPATGGSGSVGVIAPAACVWTAASNDPWLTFSPPGSTGSGDVSFVAQANTTATARSGTLTIAGLTYTVNQGPAPCSYTLAGTGTTVSAGGATGSFGFSTTTSGCSPTELSFAGWLHITPAFSGTTGSVSFTADPNPSGLSRSGVIQVDTQTYTVTQLGAACAFSLNIYGAAFSSAGQANNTLLGSPSALGCAPTVSVDLPTIVTLGPLTGPGEGSPPNPANIFKQLYSVSPFNDSLVPTVRRFTISFGGALLVGKQTSW